MIRLSEGQQLWNLDFEFAVQTNKIKLSNFLFAAKFDSFTHTKSM